MARMPNTGDTKLDKMRYWIGVNGHYTAYLIALQMTDQELADAIAEVPDDGTALSVMLRTTQQTKGRKRPADLGMHSSLPPYVLARRAGRL